jgi:CRP/FNR family cyclic AMP-dependent transcriptional regulator
VRLNADTPDRYRELSTFEHTGDSYIIDPRGEIIAGPAQGETSLIAEGSMEADRAAKALSDIGGHYSRPDLLRLIVDRSPQTRMAERGIAPDPENADRAARQRQVLDGQQPSCLVLPELFLPEFWGVCRMHTVLDYCTGGIERSLTAGATVIREGETTGHLYILIEGRLEVVKGDTVVAIITEPGAVLGEMSVLLDQPHTATVRAASDSTIYEFGDAASFLHEQPAVALLVARLLAQRLNVATTYLADIMKQYAGHGDHLAMVGEILQSMINLPPIKISPGSDRQSDPRN